MKQHKKAILFLAFAVLFALTVVFFGCNPSEPEDNGGNGGNNNQIGTEVTFTAENIGQYLEGLNQGDHFKMVTDEGFAMGYSKVGDSDYILYEQYEGVSGGVTQVTEHYIGQVDGQYLECTKVTMGEQTQATKQKLSEGYARNYLYEQSQSPVFFTQVFDFGPAQIERMKMAKIYGEQYGEYSVSGSGIVSGGKIQSGTITVTSIAVNEYYDSGYYRHLNVPITETVVITVADGKFASMEYTSAVDPEYLPEDDRGDDALGTQTITFVWGEVLAMPSWEAVDITSTEEATVWVYNATLEGQKSYIENLTPGSLIDLPDPVDEGAEFLGWYYDRYYRFPIVGKYQVGYSSEQNHVYAKWDVSAPNLEFNGGVLDWYDNEDLEAAVRLQDIADIEPIKAGYEFAGWYFDAEFNEKVSYTDKTFVSSSITLYAKWNKLTKVTLEADLTYKLLPVAEQPDNYIYPTWVVKKGKVVEGWYLDADFTQIFDGKVKQNDFTVYAKLIDAVAVNISVEGTLMEDQAGVPKFINIDPSWTFEDFKDYLDYLIDETYMKDGATYKFSKWYTDAAKTQELTELPTSEITIYPSFEIKEED
jgi:uncharacterized repeat protein (TIGR02543 family)